MNLSHKFRLFFAFCAFALSLSGVWSETAPIDLSAPLPRDPAIVDGTLPNGISYRVVKNAEKTWESHEGTLSFKRE
jgi:hypothetical protein